MGCSVLQCVAVRCSALQCVKVCWSVPECVEMCWSLWKRVAVRCSVSKCVAACRSVLQCIVRTCAHVSAPTSRVALQSACAQVLALRPTQSIMYVPLQVNIFQESILVIVQYKYLKSCSGDLSSPESDPPHKIMRYWFYYSI